MQRHGNFYPPLPDLSGNASQLENLLVSRKEIRLGTKENSHGATDNLPRFIVELVSRGTEDGLEDGNQVRSQ